MPPEIGVWAAMAIVGLYLLLALPGVVPLAWAAMRRWPEHHVLDVVIGSVVGALAVALGWFIADKLSRVLFPPHGPVPRIFWASAYLPAWLTAWLVSRTE